MPSEPRTLSVPAIDIVLLTQIIGFLPTPVTVRPAPIFTWLFNVKLEVTQTIPPHGRPWNFHWPQPKLFDRFFDGNAIRVAAAQNLRTQAAHQGATADKRRTKPDSFLLRESDHLDPEGKPSPFERLKQRDRKDYSKNAIVRSRIGNRVEV